MNEAQTRLNKIDPKLRDAKEKLEMSVSGIRAHYFELQQRLYFAV